MTMNFKDFTKSDKIKIKILQILSDFQEHTPSELASTLNTNGTTILKNCYFLNLLGIIDVDVKKTKRTSYYIKLRNNLDENSIKKIFEKIDRITKN